MKLIASAALTGLVILAIATVVSSLGVQRALADPPEKETICHAAGLAGTTHHIEISVSVNAGSQNPGNGGHFNEPGTTAAGHEEDVCDAGVTVLPPDPTVTVPSGGGSGGGTSQGVSPPAVTLQVPAAVPTAVTLQVPAAVPTSVVPATEVRSLPSAGSGGLLGSESSAASPAAGLAGTALLMAVTLHAFWRRRSER